MKFIQINGLNQKYKLLLLYVTICSICFGIARLSGIVAPFDCDFFDSICQLIIFIPLLLYKTIFFSATAPPLLNSAFRGFDGCVSDFRHSVFTLTYFPLPSSCLNEFCGKSNSYLSSSIDKIYPPCFFQCFFVFFFLVFDIR